MGTGYQRGLCPRGRLFNPKRTDLANVRESQQSHQEAIHSEGIARTVGQAVLHGREQCLIDGVGDFAKPDSTLVLGLEASSLLERMKARRTPRGAHHGAYGAHHGASLDSPLQPLGSLIAVGLPAPSNRTSCLQDHSSIS